MRYHADLQWVRMAFRDFSRTVVISGVDLTLNLCGFRPYAHGQYFEGNRRKNLRNHWAGYVLTRNRPAGSPSVSSTIKTLSQDFGWLEKYKPDRIVGKT